MALPQLSLRLYQANVVIIDIRRRICSCPGLRCLEVSSSISIQATTCRKEIGLKQIPMRPAAVVEDHLLDPNDMV